MGARLKNRKDVFDSLPLLLIFEVVDGGTEEEPDSVGEEKVDFAGSAQDFANLLHLNSLELRVQVKGAELRNEELQVGPRGHTVS